MGGVKPTWHNSRFNHSDRSGPDCLEYLNCREQAEALIELPIVPSSSDALE